MKRHHAVLLALVNVAAMSLVLGCASSPDMAADAPAQMKVRLAPERDLARHGVTVDNDPLVAPLSLLHQKDEFVVFAVDLVLPRAARVVLDGGVRADNGDIAARLYTRVEMSEYWKARLNSTNPNLSGRLEVLDRYCAPSLDFNARRGRHEYYIVCIGKAPIPRPATAELLVAIDGGQPESYHFPLPDAK